VSVNLYDPQTYFESAPHQAFTELRATDPVHWQDIPGQPGYWMLLKHADVEHVARNPQLFSASLGGIVIEDGDEESLAGQREMLLAMDPPRHRWYRRPLIPSFGLRTIAGLEERIREISRDALAAVERRDQVEFVQEVAAVLPTTVTGELFGIPEADWGHLHHLAELGTRAGDIGNDRDTENGEGYTGRDTSIQMGMYGFQHASRRREQEPRADLTDVILSADFGEGHHLSDAEFGAFFVQIFTAGQDTTQTMLAGGLLALLEHPDQLELLRREPARIPLAVEEILRWANPLHYFRRTATEDTELRGAQIKAGDKVAMIYTSANRDEDVFPDAQAFDITRSPNRHLSFGLAEHFCLGVHLARLEGRVFFEELLARYSRIELAGSPVRVRSNLNNGLNKLPVSLTS
jgi:cytochrome P450